MTNPIDTALFLAFLITVAALVVTLRAMGAM